MSIDAIKRELAGLDDSHRNQMVAYLLSLGHQKDTQYRTALTRKIDDRDASHRATLGDLDERLSIRETTE